MLEATLFGQFTIRLDGRPVELSSRPAQGLLAYLLLHPGIAHRREQLAGLLWPDFLESSARKNLRNTIWQVRKVVGERYLQTGKETVAFAPSAPFSLDVAALAQETLDADALIGAVSVYKGELLPGFYEDWVQLERERLRALFERRMQALLDSLVAAGRWAEVFTWAEHWIARGYTPEPAYRALMAAHAAQGDLAGVAAAYRRAAQALIEELGVAPSPETQDLYERLLQGGTPASGQVDQREAQEVMDRPGELARAQAAPRGPEQQIRFCSTADGAQIAFATVGQGPPLIKASNWLSHLEFEWRSPIWRHWLLGLSSGRTLIRYDERGNGLSDWDVDEISFEAWLRDLEAVVEASGVERFALFGMSRGGPLAIAYAARHPERVTRLVLYGAYARGRLRRSLTPQQQEEQEALLKLVRLGWGQENPAFRQIFTSYFIPGGTMEQYQWFNDLQRVSASPENAARILAASGGIDVRDLARRVAAPTLVLHGRSDARIPFEEGRLLAALIPGARFVPLESRNHILLADEPAWGRFLAEVDQFLAPEA